MSDVAPVLGVPARIAGKDGPASAPEVAARTGRRRLLGTWVVTVAATAVSTCALDGVATAAGVLLVASGALRDLPHWQTLVLLAASYAAWGAGLRANLRANWSLLEQTATSTNALSKAAHDLTQRRTASVRARRIAAAAGYLGTELAKEAPYYAGAFGAAVLSDSVSSSDAIVFLAGTNLGAAGYEYGLATTPTTSGSCSDRDACCDGAALMRVSLRSLSSGGQPDPRGAGHLGRQTSPP